MCHTVPQLGGQGENTDEEHGSQLLWEPAKPSKGLEGKASVDAAKVQALPVPFCACGCPEDQKQLPTRRT